MTPERFQQIDKLLDLALEREPCERRRFLDEACDGDEALRMKLESLLRSHEQASGSLVNPPSNLADEILAVREQTHAPAEGSDWPASASKILGRYVVTEKLGGGGMGVVYAAHDPELNRKIAIKLMPPVLSDSMSASEGRARLLREAQAMARLSHPNVIVIYDVGTFDEEVFIAMEHVEGSTLAEWMSQRKRPWREIASTFVQAGRGLAAAHAAGIVHRDFKPDNVLVDNDGRARVLDFGLARAAHAAAGTNGEAAASTAAKAVSAGAGMLGNAVTEPGKLMGTPAYMAPEQLKGQQGDAWSDQFSFCVALYQALYGERPFVGETVAALLEQMEQKNIGQAPSAVRVPARIRKALLRGLSWEREARYESMDRLLHELTRRPPAIWRWPLGAAVVLAALFAIGRFGREKPNTAQLRSIAVLPLENLTGDPTQEYFVDGMTDALTTNLAGIRSLHVISRTSVIQYKATKKPLPEIARELNVDAIVEGTVARWGDRVRIDAQLIHAATDRHLWASSYQRDLRDILALQSDVARAIAAEVQTELTPEEQSRLASPRTVNSEAYEAYLKGRYSSSKGTADGNNKGIEYYRQAIEKDPAYALAYAGLADTYNLLGFGQLAELPPKEAARNARTAAMKALELDDSLSEAHAALGFTKFSYDWDWVGAEKEYRRAVELNPNNAMAYHRYTFLLLRTRRYDEALRNIKRAHQIDPLSPSIHRVLVESLVNAGQADQAMEQTRKMLELHSESSHAHFGAGILYAQMGMHQEAIAELEKASSLSGGNAGIQSLLAESYIATGRRAEAEKILNELRARPDSATSAFWAAAIYADLGRKNEAFEWLEKCYEAHCAAMVHLNYRLAPLRSDPRYQDLLRRVGFPE